MTSPVRRLPATQRGIDDAPTAPAHIVLALGANLGQREAILRSAVEGLAGMAGLVVDAVSPVVETDPVGGPAQGRYLNAVVVARTAMSPSALLVQCQRIEAGHGRERLVRWGARTLDVDIISYDDLVCETAELTLPHPRAHLRAFVLVPWARVDPTAVLPGPQGGRVRDLADGAADAGAVRPYPSLVLDLGRDLP